jgi:ERF superfamily protein
MKQAAAEQPAPSAPPAASAPLPPQEQLPQAASPPQAITRQIDIQALLERAITDNSAVEVVKELLQMTKEVRAIQAREAWYRAMADFQRQCPPIRKTKEADIVSQKGARFKYRYAPLDEILETTRPIMGPLGLSVSWTTRFENRTVIANCKVSHEAGHFEESGEVPIPVDEGGMGASVAQRIGIATTYGKRYSLLSIIGIAPEDDDDAAHGDQPRSTVQQPRRTSDTQPAASEQAGDRILIVGAIADVEPKTTAAKKPYWRIKFDLAEGEESIFVNCWSESMAQSAIRMKAEGVLVHLWYKLNGEFKNLFDLSAAPIEG